MGPQCLHIPLPRVLCYYLHLYMQLVFPCVNIFIVFSVVDSSYKRITEFLPMLQNCRCKLQIFFPGVLFSVLKCLMSCLCFMAATSRPFVHFPGSAPRHCAIQSVSGQRVPDEIGTVNFGVTPSSYNFSCLYFLPMY